MGRGADDPPRGQAGGRRTVARYGTAHMQAIGRKGWAAMVARYGTEALCRNGKKGFQATADRYFGGDRQALISWLRDAGLAAQDPMPHTGAWPRRPAWPAASAHAPSERSTRDD